MTYLGGSGTEAVEEGLVEPATVRLPKNLSVAWSLGKVSSNGSVLIQVMIVSSTAVTEYKGITQASGGSMGGRGALGVRAPPHPQI